MYDFTKDSVLPDPVPVATIVDFGLGLGQK